MNTINIDASFGGVIPLGKRGETGATAVVFDLSQFIESFGNGTATLLAKRPTENTAYPCASEREGDALTWTVSNADTYYVGYGRVELFWYVGEVLAKSVVFLTQITPDIGDEGEAPQPQASWVEQMLAEVQEKVDAAEAAKDAAEQAKTDTEGLLSQTVYIGTDGNFYTGG